MTGVRKHIVGYVCWEKLSEIAVENYNIKIQQWDQLRQIMTANRDSIIKVLSWIGIVLSQTFMTYEYRQQKGFLVCFEVNKTHYDQKIIQDETNYQVRAVYCEKPWLPNCGQNLNSNTRSKVVSMGYLKQISFFNKLTQVSLLRTQQHRILGSNLCWCCDIN